MTVKYIRPEGGVEGNYAQEDDNYHDGFNQNSVTFVDTNADQTLENTIETYVNDESIIKGPTDESTIQTKNSKVASYRSGNPKWGMYKEMPSLSSQSKSKSRFN